MQKHYFSNEIVEIFFEILLPKTKTRIIDWNYLPSNLLTQKNFLKLPNKNFRTIGPDAKEKYILGDFCSSSHLALIINY